MATCRGQAPCQPVTAAMAGESLEHYFTVEVVGTVIWYDT